MRDGIAIWRRNRVPKQESAVGGEAGAQSSRRSGTPHRHGVGVACAVGTARPACPRQRAGGKLPVSGGAAPRRTAGGRDAIYPATASDRNERSLRRAWNIRVFTVLTGQSTIAAISSHE